MAQPTSFRVFLSAVTNELASYRTEVARVLRRKGIEVRDQEHFRQGGATLAEALRDYIHECDAVILLVGDQCGSLVDEEHAAVLGKNGWFDQFKQATKCSQASYTQWEFLLAKQFGKPTYTFLTADSFQPDKPSQDKSPQQQCQTKYRAWIDETGEHYEPLTTKAKLVEDILVLPFPDLERGKPINLPFPSLGKLFKGRAEFLARLRASLLQVHERTGTTIVGRAVYGLGGVGKTRLAIEYAWRHAEDYASLLFVSADSPEALRWNLAELCGPLVLDLPEQHASEEKLRYVAVVRWLQKHPGWLLILDDVSSPNAANAAIDLLSHLSGGHVVLTSRLATWSGSVEPLALDVLTVDDAADFLLTRTESRRRAAADDPQQARELAEEVGQLVLALEQAGAYIAERRISLADYLNRWRSHAQEVQSWQDGNKEYPTSVSTAFLTSLHRVSSNAKQLLQLLCWLADAPIPPGLFETDKFAATFAELSNVQDVNIGKALAYQAIRELESLSLLRFEKRSREWSMHTLLRTVVQRNIANNEKVTWFKKIQMIYSEYYEDTSQRKHMAALQTLEETFTPRRVHKSVFISYRREQTRYLARLIYDRLNGLGFDVFMDVKNLEVGRFDEVIVTEIKKRAHFLAIISEGSLARCINEGDWVRLEFEFAANSERNIIPVFDGDPGKEELSRGLPKSMSTLASFNGIVAHFDLFDAFLDELHKRLNQPIRASTD